MTVKWRGLEVAVTSIMEELKFDPNVIHELNRGVYNFDLTDDYMVGRWMDAIFSESYPTLVAVPPVALSEYAPAREALQFYFDYKWEEWKGLMRANGNIG